MGVFAVFFTSGSAGLCPALLVGRWPCLPAGRRVQFSVTVYLTPRRPARYLRASREPARSYLAQTGANREPPTLNRDGYPHSWRVWRCMHAGCTKHRMQSAERKLAGELPMYAAVPRPQGAPRSSGHRPGEETTRLGHVTCPWPHAFAATARLLGWENALGGISYKQWGRLPPKHGRNSWQIIHSSSKKRQAETQLNAAETTASNHPASASTPCSQHLHPHPSAP